MVVALVLVPTWKEEPVTVSTDVLALARVVCPLTFMLPVTPRLVDVAEAKVVFPVTERVPCAVIEVPPTKEVAKRLVEVELVITEEVANTF